MCSVLKYHASYQKSETQKIIILNGRANKPCCRLPWFCNYPFNEQTCIQQHLYIIWHIQNFVYINEKTPECKNVYLKRERPAWVNTHIHSITHTHAQANKVTDTLTNTQKWKLNSVYTTAQLASQRICAFHICVLSWNCSGSRNGEFSAPFKTKPGID